jgi:hypothetical protein
MDLTDEQKRKIGLWINEGMKLSDIQARLAQEDNVHLTYMEVRFLVDDLKLTPKDLAPREAEVPLAAAAPPPNASPLEATAPALGNEKSTPGGGRVSVQVDEITRAGAIVSGTVTFSDGKQAGWYLDQLGRLGMVPEEQGYRPPQSDVAEFQMALEKELARLGM